MDEFELAGGAKLIVIGAEPDGSVVNADLEIVDESGSRWSATAMTLSAIADVMDRHRATGESEGGAFFASPDLLILRESSIDSVVGLATKFVQSGEYVNEFKRLEG